MNEPTSHMISVRAVEDIIQIQKIIEDAPNLKTLQLAKEKSSERVVYSALKYDLCSPETANNSLNCFLKECDMEKSFKCNEKNYKKTDFNGWESDYSLNKYMNTDVVVLENFSIIEREGSEPDVKCWSSDSDVTVLRVKKEFRHELSNKMEWEEQRNLDDVSLSSTNLDWETHSLVNLAGIIGREKDVQENLTPFNIWSKTNNKKDSSMHLVENMGFFPLSEPNTIESKLVVENCIHPENSCRIKSGLKKTRFKKLFRGVFSCFVKKKSL